jgi:CRISPR-associated protein Csb2
MLCLEVEFLTGVSVAATPYARDEPEWPPHPDRLFQALVAAWGRDEPPDAAERHALEWLEGLDGNALVVRAPAAHRREVATVFVPPNDARTTGNAGAKPPAALAPTLRVIPEQRKNRKPRAFPAVLPQACPAVARYVWDPAPQSDVHKDSLGRLAREVTYLGHSHTLVRVAVAEDSLSRADDNDDETWVPKNGAALRMPHKGRLEHLVERHRQSTNGRIARPAPSLVTRAFERKEPQPPATLFDGDNVTVFADDGGFVPALEAFPLVAKRLRDALLTTAKDNGLEIPTLISGHDVDGRPTAEPHIAVVPLADVGWTHSQGRSMGLALVWPRETDTPERKAALRIVARFVGTSSSIGLLHFGRDGSWRLALEPGSDLASLRFGRYVRPARRWATVLPAALDRHPKDRPGEELAAIVAQAGLNVGIPPEAVDGLDVELHKHSAVRGAPSVRDVRAALPADSRYRAKPLAHLVLTFPTPIRGPLILGAGRFRGLGLCLPLDDGGEI